MHLSIVHKEIVEIKKEAITFKDEPNLDTEKVLLMCDICDFKFETQMTLNKHIDSQRVENKIFQCEICDYSCPKKATLKKLNLFMRKRNHSHVTFVTTAAHERMT